MQQQLIPVQSPTVSDDINHSEQRYRWGVILAGGDGKRLLPLTRKISGDDRPKQFCPVVGGQSLLDETRSRVARVVPAERTLVMVTKVHERYYADQLDDSCASSWLIQPENRGTAPL